MQSDHRHCPCFLQNAIPQSCHLEFPLLLFRLGSIYSHSPLNLKSLAGYVQKRRDEGIGNRTINIEVGVLRCALKKFKLWNRLAEDYKRLPESTDIGRALTPEEELRLFATASSRPEWEVVFCISRITANTTAGGVELRNARLGDIDLKAQTLAGRVGKNRFRARILPLIQSALWAVERLLERAKEMGATEPGHYLTSRRVSGKEYDPTQPPIRWGWRTAWRTFTAECGLKGLRPHDLRHHAITKPAESSEASEQTIMSIAGHVSVEMLRYYSHVRQEAKREAVAALDNGTITSQLDKWKKNADDERRHKQLKSKNLMVGTGRFELPTPRTPSECSTRLSHVPTQSSRLTRSRLWGRP
jgi:integrase